MCWAVALILPFYWFWDRIAARTDMLVLIGGLLAWAEWNWWRFSAGVLSRIRKLPECL
ncbi:MAG TPA: hypothetical protein VJT70_10360 [Sphingomicrobium sp.]|nr:hypothetical protein [Sphingomicrobium sp.]